jgi:hypothetical protein
MMNRWSDVELAGPVERQRSNLNNSLLALPLRVTR